MSLNFNVDPYYDDFDPSKNYHRILFKPGYAVQARELTQSQSILQDQVTKFADNIFKQNSPVTGGQITSNLNCSYVKLQQTYNSVAVDVTQFANKIIQNATGTVVAQVLSTVAATGTAATDDPPTLIVSYKTGTHFVENDVVYDSASNLAASVYPTLATGDSSIVSIAQGVFYISSNYTRSDGIKISNGTFVQVDPQSVVVSKYSNIPSSRVGLNITESIQTFVGDSSLLDPAIGASNYQAPGADRYKISLTLETRPLTLGDDEGFIELLRINNGQIVKIVEGSVYNVIDDYFAKRDYETNGDYVVNDFKLTPKANTADTSNNTYLMSVGKGVAYVHGYRLENQSDVELTSNRARTTASQNNNPVYIDFGSYFYVNNLNGTSNGSFFDTTTYGTADLHCVSSANVVVANSAHYTSTLVATANVRAIIYDSATSDTAANTYNYKLYVTNLQNQVVSNTAVSATVNTITFPSSFTAASNAYAGVDISITGGTDAGDFRTITTYNGATRTATVNQNWTVTPDATSTFSLNFDTKDIESIINVSKASYPATIYGVSSVNTQGRVGGLLTGDTQLQNPTVPELVFTIGNPYVSTLIDTSYTTQQVHRSVSFTTSGAGVSATINYQGDYQDVVQHFGTASSTLSNDTKKQNFIIVVTAKGAGCTLNVGDVVPWTTAGRTITLDSTKSVATLSATDVGGATGTFTATIYEKVYVVNGQNTGHILKNKTLIRANTTAINTSNTAVGSYTFVDNNTTTSTGQIYIRNAGLVTAGQKQSLYLSDVKRIVKIIDTGNANTVPSLAMLSSSSYDITNSYSFDNGQRDSYYDHASITLKPGYRQPIGNILVMVDYYQHSGGDGYFSVNSYTNESYQQIPQFISTHGTIYSLRDCIDFRPARLNATTSWELRYSNSASNKGIFIPVDLTTFTGDYTYYLGRKDKLILSKDRSFQIVEGSPAIYPLFPAEPDGSLVIAKLTHNPYTGYIPTEAPAGFVSDLSIEKVKHKRYTMQDIAGLENRINQVEYYTSLSMLEQKAQNLQISDAFGLNRFKNGILVDDFSSYATADTNNDDYSATINRRERRLTATQAVKNYPLKALATAYNMGMPSAATSAALGYSIKTDGYINYFSLPYTTANAVTQRIASRTVNANPFSYATREGTLTLSPNVDNWVDTNYSPALLITDPNLQIFRANTQAINVLSAGDWKTISGTSYTTSQTVEGHGINWSPFGYVGYQSTTTYDVRQQAKSDVLGPYDKLGNTYALNNNYITDISILPYIRPQQVVVRVNNMLFNTPVGVRFDNTDVSNYVRKTNVIELTGVSGTFAQDQVIGYYSSGSFYGTSRIVGIYNYPGTTNTRLYVAADGTSTKYSSTGTTSGTIQNAFFDASGTYQSTTASGTIASSEHFGGRVNNAISTAQVQLSPLASSTDNYYTGNTIYINAGTGVGQSSIISAYNGTTKTANLTTSITSANGDVYSIGTFTTNRTGSFYGIFNIPANQFHTGERVLRVDNGVNGNLDSATSYAQGTYYAQGLQTTQQTVDFGASPAGAKGTFTSTQYANTNSIVTTYSPWDPVAQTFIVSKDNYPNGLFLNSVKLFFKTKPTLDNSPVTISIVGTQNGYPNGETLDHSIVTLNPSDVNVSDAPQYLTASTYTEFTFNAPIYIQPGVLYSFIVKSNSSEYTLWTASNGDTAISSSVKNLPTDATPSTITKIGGAPYVGALFLSQNAQTWTADQNQSLMFVMDRCVFNTSVTPSIQYVVPKKLPQRTLVNQSLDYFLNANNLNMSIDSVSNADVLVDAFNITTTDFTPTTTNINYSYNAMLAASGSPAGIVNITPGKFGTSSTDDIYLNDGKGERVLLANTSQTFSLYTTLTSDDDSVSPIISDAGLSTYAITWNIDNCSLSNSLITLTNAGSGYNVNTTTVTVSAPTGDSGTTALASANIADGVIQSVYFTSGGSGYITTPTITIVDANTAPGTNATVIITGETSKSGGPAKAKYVTKKVVLDASLDSGDLVVYLTAYRPVNTNILVYYKILNRSDTQQFNDGSWQLMTMTNSSQSTFSQTRNDLFEYTYAPGINNTANGYVTYTSTNGQKYTSFSQFAIKIVLTTTDKTAVPFISDMRAIALPSNVNTTV
jgi:hypothetical protein